MLNYLNVLFLLFRYYAKKNAIEYQFKNWQLALFLLFLSTKYFITHYNIFYSFFLARHQI